MYREHEWGNWLKDLGYQDVRVTNNRRIRKTPGVIGPSGLSAVEAKTVRGEMARVPTDWEAPYRENMWTVNHFTNRCSTCQLFIGKEGAATILREVELNKPWRKDWSIHSGVVGVCFYAPLKPKQLAKLDTKNHGCTLKSPDIRAVEHRQNGIIYKS